jgi:hypothetical protein
VPTTPARTLRAGQKGAVERTAGIVSAAAPGRVVRIR